MLAESATATHKEKKFLRNLEVPSLAIPAELDEDEIFSAEQEENSQAAQTPRASQSVSEISWIARLDSQNESQFIESQFGEESDDDETPPLSPAGESEQNPANPPEHASQLSLEGALLDMIPDHCL